jgi:hypothetical protein
MGDPFMTPLYDWDATDPFTLLYRFDFARLKGNVWKCEKIAI